jgi:dienelactone hydrolase
VQTGLIDYSDGETAFQGYVAHDVSREKKPAVIVAPTFAGRDLFACGKAEALAQLGYVGFALDPYGGARVGATREECAALMAPLATDRGLLRRRLGAAIEAVRAHPKVDADRIAAIGFCFGGLCVLDMARMGADLRGVAAFHGVLRPAQGIPNAKIVAKVLALHGWDDPLNPKEAVTAFAEEMTEAGADWQIHAYGNTMHAFSNPTANDPRTGNLYQPTSFRRAWRAMRDFLDEVL